MYSYLSSPFPFIIFFSFFIPFFQLSYSADDPNYTACSQKFECGNLSNVSYPFWGKDRPNYCGHPNFQLNCQDDIADMRIGSQIYHVLNITGGLQTMQISTISDACPSPPPNISLPSDLFNYSLSLPMNRNLVFAYGCKYYPDIYTSRHVYCPLNNTVGANYFSVATPTPDYYSGCEFIVVVPVLEKLVQNLTSTQLTMKDVLKQGFEVRYDVNASFCDRCEKSSGRCGFNITTIQPTCYYCYNGEYPETYPSFPTSTVGIRSRSTRMKLMIGLGAVMSCGLLLVIVMCILRRKKYHLFSESKISWKRNSQDQRLMEIFLKNCGSMAPKRYSYSDIKKLTCSFKDKIGQGGFGEVYKGKLLDGRFVAVKLLNKAKGNGEDFINEVASISRTSHVNIVSLIGFCFDTSKRALVYEFMTNGSMEKFIYSHNSMETQFQLGWEALFKISVGVARGLEYLHRGCNTLILHLDIKPHNILLDHDFNPKISDFGLAKLYPRDESITSMLNARGTPGYIAPEMFNRNFGRVSHKSDVYSYGMMILEMVGKRKNIDVAVDHISEIYFPQWIYKRLELEEDLGLGGFLSEAEDEITRKMILVALWCIQSNSMDRPAMSRVVEMLEGKLEQLSIPPKPYLCSPPGSPRRVLPTDD